MSVWQRVGLDAKGPTDSSVEGIVRLNGWPAGVGVGWLVCVWEGGKVRGGVGEVR